MSRAPNPLPSPWRLHELFRLSDAYASGLEWRISKGGHKAGEQAGNLNKKTGFYMVSVDNRIYLAHRIVYFMRTQQDIINYIVSHDPSNQLKDNRQTLIAIKLKKSSPTQNNG